MSQPPPLPQRSKSFPVIMSAAVYPGVGQYMVGRRVIGLAYAGAFTFALGIFIIFFYRYFSALLVGFMGIAGSSRPVSGPPSPRELLMPGVYILVIYLANVYDIFWHLHRPKRLKPE